MLNNYIFVFSNLHIPHKYISIHNSKHYFVPIYKTRLIMMDAFTYLVLNILWLYQLRLQPYSCLQKVILCNRCRYKSSWYVRMGWTIRSAVSAWNMREKVSNCIPMPATVTHFCDQIFHSLMFKSCMETCRSIITLTMIFFHRFLKKFMLAINILLKGCRRNGAFIKSSSED